MNHRVFLQLVKRNLLMLILVPTLVGLGAYLLSSRQEKVYSAAATLLLRPNDPTESLTASGKGNEFGGVSKALVTIAEGPKVREAAASLLGDVGAAEIRRALYVTIQPTNNTMVFKALTASPARSAAIANATAKMYIENRRLSAVDGLQRAISDIDKKLQELEKSSASLAAGAKSDRSDIALTTATAQYQTLSDRRLQLSIDSELKRGEAELADEATEPSMPVSPTPRRTATLGFVVGALAAVAVVLLRDRLDSRIRDRAEAEILTALPTLAEIPLDRSMSRDPNVVAAIAAPAGLVAE